jgi:hypothetical protein
MYVPPVVKRDRSKYTPEQRFENFKKFLKNLEIVYEGKYSITSNRKLEDFKD